MLKISQWKITHTDDEVAKQFDVQLEEPDMDHIKSDIILETVTLGSETELGKGNDSCSVSAAHTQKQNIEGIDEITW